MVLDWALIGVLTGLNVAILAFTIAYLSRKGRTYLSMKLPAFMDHAYGTFRAKAMADVEKLQEEKIPEFMDYAYTYFRNRVNLELAEVQKKGASDEGSGGMDLGGLAAMGQQFLGGGGGTGGLGQIMQLFQAFGQMQGQGGGSTSSPGSHRPGLNSK